MVLAALDLESFLVGDFMTCHDTFVESKGTNVKSVVCLKSGP